MSTKKTPAIKAKNTKRNSRSMAVVQMTPRGRRVKKHVSMCAAQEATGINSGSISKATRGITNTAGGFRWELAATK
jgi:hypothetical protein